MIKSSEEAFIIPIDPKQLFPSQIFFYGKEKTL